MYQKQPKLKIEKVQNRLYMYKGYLFESVGAGMKQYYKMYDGEKTKVLTRIVGSLAHVQFMVDRWEKNGTLEKIK